MITNEEIKEQFYKVLYDNLYEELKDEPNINVEESIQTLIEENVENFGGWDSLIEDVSFLLSKGIPLEDQLRLVELGFVQEEDLE